MGFDSAVNTKIIKSIERAILKNVGGLEALAEEFPKLIRRAIDEVIDTPRTGRLTLDQIEKTEKTYIGTKIEILFRSFIGFPKGFLDLNINGVDVDIKNTVTGNWMIPNEAINKPCILIEADEKRALCGLGIIVAHPNYLTKGANRDQKRSISSTGRSHIHWLLNKQPYPVNFWQDFLPQQAWEIFRHEHANERLVTLFKILIGKPIPRTVVEGVARQKDYMKRLRKNGGARDALAKAGIALLSGMYDKSLIQQLGLSFCKKDEFISCRADTAEKKKALFDKIS